MRGKAEANPEIPRFARNKLRNPVLAERDCHALSQGGIARNDTAKGFNAFVLFGFSLDYSVIWDL